jgi:3-keto-5-aminohexanoate cleavage enzyme
MGMAEMFRQASTWSVMGIIASQPQMGIHALLLGGHVGAGLEESIFYRKGEFAANEKFVKGMVRLSRELDREVATSDKAREIMALIPAMRGG